MEDKGNDKLTTTKQFFDLALELECFLKSMHGLYLDSLLGYKLIDETIKKDHDFLKSFSSDPEILSGELHKTCSFSHKQVFKGPIPSADLFAYNNAEVEARVKETGVNCHYLGLVVIVSLYSWWEYSFREKLSCACGQKNIKCFFWGDLRLLRNRLLHDGANTRKEFKSGAKTSFFKELAEEADIFLSVEIIAHIFRLMYVCHNHLFTKSLTSTEIRVPIEQR